MSVVLKSGVPASSFSTFFLPKQHENISYTKILPRIYTCPRVEAPSLISMLFLKLEFYPQMAYSSHAMNEGEVILPSFSWGSYEYEGVPTNGDHLPSDATLYGCPLFNSSGYHQEGLLQAIIPSPCREEEPGFPTSPWDITLETESYDGEQQPYNGCGNWLNDCNSVFNGCWEDNYGSIGNVSNNNLENMENSNPSEEQGESSLTRRDDEDAENHSAACDYDPWSCCGSWLTFGRENFYLANDGEETDVSYEWVLRDAGVYEGIFGHWPCLYRRH